MAKKFQELVDRTMSAAAQQRARRKTEEMLGAMALDELRSALDLTQQHLAEALGVKQSSVSKIIRGQNMYISTLDKVIKAMGGDLEVYVALPAGRVRLTLDQFRSLANEPEKAAEREPAAERVKHTRRERVAAG
jgi:plasmid maintenance system antidote protein VapI